MKAQLFSNIILAAFVLAVAAMLLVPLPTAVLDILLALNISFSLLLLLVGLYMPNALALLSFPSILLLTTLFRLGLNVASTRLILSQGEAGKIIDAFGSFLIQGEIVVGVIIFIIITVVNFIVIARGAGRVSEVAARFALDSLPGKQMAIDADLRSGVIDVAQAENRREDLRKESQLYGSMDGAMKFVQGDAIAGIFIIFTNIIGGMYLGIQKGMSFSDAIQTYTTLTVGDGLVSQIPALLISICAGIVVTRVSSGQNATLGSDIGRQLFNNPTLLTITAFVLLALSVLPGVPALPFVLVAITLLVTAYFLHAWRQSEAGINYVAVDRAGVAMLGSSSELLKLPETDARLQLKLGKQLYQLYEQRADYYQSCWQALQAASYQNYGVNVGNISIVPALDLTYNSYLFQISGSRIIQAELKPGLLFVEASPNNAEIFGFDLISLQEHPLYACQGIWVPASNDQKKLAEAAGIANYDSVEYVFLSILANLKNNPEELVTMTDIQNLLRLHEKNSPGITDQVLVANFINPARLTEIFQQLVREGLSVRDSQQILEQVATYCSTYRSSMVNNDDFDLNDIVSYVRMRRKKAVVNDLLSRRASLKFIALSASVNELFSTARYDQNLRRVTINAEQKERLKQSLIDLLEPMCTRGSYPVALLVSSDIRHKLQSFLIQVGNKLRVITSDELDTYTNSELVSIWSV